ncbi:MAG: SprB repeat-containing protein, partial [Saprospiraceae bacterium]
MNNHLSPLNTTLHPAIWQNYWRLLLLSFLFVFFMVFKGFGQLSVELVSINPQCGGFATGVITAIPSGGTAPYSYLWSTNSTSNPITNLQPGIYSVTVTDVLGDTATATDTLTAPPPLSVHINVDTCTLPGAMTVNVSGGVTPYSYTWNTGDTTASIGNLSMGEYCVTVLDNNNCGFVTCQTIGSPLNAFVSTTDVVCEISQGGTATAGHTGGVFPFSYSWNSGQSTETIENLPPGIYTTTVTSYNGCTATASDTVGLVPGNFDVALTPTQPTCWGSYTGSIEATVPVSSDTAFFYKWSNSEYGPIIDSLQAGTYVVTVSDSYGCTGIDSSTLSYLSHLSLTLLANDPTCHDSGDGSITANPSGGVLPYNFAWSNGDTTATIQNLGAGTYAVVVTDSLLCSATMADTLTAPPLFYIDMTSLDASQCGAQDGSATATPGGGGSPPFTYEWNNGGADSTLTQLAAGNYTAKVTSAEGCIATDSVEINQPDTLGVSISGTTLICGADSSGTLTANVLFGTGPFSYNWSNGDTTETIADLPAGSYDVTVTSSEGCTGLQNYAIEGSPDILISLTPNYIDCFGNDNGQIVANSSGGTPPLSFLWSNGATGSTISNLVAGSYTLSVTDAWGCSQASQALITSPDSLVLSLNPVPGDCGQNGSIDLEITGGTLPYNILWNNGDTTTAVQNAPAGLYNVTVTDGNGCQAFGTTTLPGQSVLQLIFATNNATCNGTSDGEIQAWATAGVPPYDYQWNNGDSGSLISNLSTGLYEVTLTDATGCSLVSAVEIMALHA